MTIALFCFRLFSLLLLLSSLYSTFFFFSCFHIPPCTYVSVYVCLFLLCGRQVGMHFRRTTPLLPPVCFPVCTGGFQKTACRTCLCRSFVCTLWTVFDLLWWWWWRWLLSESRPQKKKKTKKWRLFILLLLLCVCVWTLKSAIYTSLSLSDLVYFFASPDTTFSCSLLFLSLLQRLLSLFFFLLSFVFSCSSLLLVFLSSLNRGKGASSERAFIRLNEEPSVAHTRTHTHIRI
jgi:hypothetical protein